jgi:hypothetical protein
MAIIMAVVDPSALGATTVLIWAILFKVVRRIADRRGAKKRKTIRERTITTKLTKKRKAREELVTRVFNTNDLDLLISALGTGYKRVRNPCRM